MIHTNIISDSSIDVTKYTNNNKLLI